MSNNKYKKEKIKLLSSRSALGFIILLGIVSLFADMTYEGGRSLIGQYLKILGASAAAVGIAAGAGEFLGYALRLVSGIFSDKTQKYWTITIVGYVINLFALPSLALVGQWEIAIGLIFAERIGKAIRKPARDAMLSYATSQTGRGFGFGLHEAMDQIGAFLGPTILSLILLIKSQAQKAGDNIEGYKTAFLVLLIPALLAILTLIIARFLFPEPKQLETKKPEIAVKKYGSSYWWYLAGAGLIAAGFADFPLIAYHLKKISIAKEFWIPIFYAGAMAVDAITAIIAGKLFDKKGFPVVIVIFGMSALFAPFVYLGGLVSIIFGLILWGISIGAQESIMRAVVANMAPPEKRGTAFGLFHTGFGVMWFLGSATMGMLYDWNIYAIVIFSVIIQLCAIPVFIKANKESKKQNT